MNGRHSSLKRVDYLKKLANEPLDLLVIGGGITGAGIALDAASRGLKVGLVEKQDFAQGTSSRSTKLIHGGLRYLKQGELKLVREVGRERAILYRNAPHIVIPEKMLLPLVQGGTYGKLATSVGLWIYDRLAGVKKEERRIMLNKEETEAQEPLLRKDILKGGGLYIEYRTDDARLTIEVIKTAVSFGAICVNYAEVVEFIYNEGKVVGVKVTDRITGSQYFIQARKIVNATGPWADQLRAKDHSLRGKRLHLTKGVHLVVPNSRLPLNQSIYFDVPDGRMIFAIPRDHITYIGTTDTNYHGVIDRPRVTKADVSYLLQAVNHMFPSVHLTERDIISSWAGLRPLIHEEGKSPSELSRKDEIFLSESGLITIAGGKLTGFRKMAERVVDLVIKQLTDSETIKLKQCHTDQIPLSGGRFSEPGEIPSYIRELVRVYQSIPFSEDQIRFLTGLFGSNTKGILERAKELYDEGNYTLQEALILAELEYTINEEMVTNISDFLIRRTGRSYFYRESLNPEMIQFIQDKMSAIFGWDEERKAENLRKFEEEHRSFVEFVEHEDE